MSDIYCGRCREDAWFAVTCAGGCGRTLCEDCQGDEGYCPECYRGEAVPTVASLLAKVDRLTAERDWLRDRLRDAVAALEVEVFRR